MPVANKCESCGVEFEVAKYRAEIAKYCCKECRAKAMMHGANCKQCGQYFERYKSSNNTMLYCSRVCSQRSRVIPRPEKVERPMYFKTCEICKEPFRIPPTRLDTARFCSRACQKSSDDFKIECSTRTTGDKHWRWAGGEYKTNDGYIRHKRKNLDGETFNLGHRKVMLSMMLKDAPSHPFLMVVDGVSKLNPEIEVHHIDRKRDNNSPDNLLAVTKDAHARIHHYGKKPDAWECWPTNPKNW